MHDTNQQALFYLIKYKENTILYGTDVPAFSENVSYNQRTREILEQFSLLGISASSGNIIFPSGNAKKYLDAFFDKNTDYVNTYEGDANDVCTLCFSPNGNVLDGNVNRESILDIMNSYLVND